MSDFNRFFLSDGHGFARIMYVFFLGVVPFISLILFAIYYWRQHRPTLLRKSTKPNAYVPTAVAVAPAYKPHKTKLHITDTKLISSTNPHVLSNSTELFLNISEN